METPGNENKNGGEGSQLLLSRSTSVMESASGRFAPPAHENSFLGDVATTFEQLKVCLDDDSSIEDDDEDMFDDDAFTFGDEDFETLMSHEVMKRMSASMNSSQISLARGRLAAPASAAVTAQDSLLPLHQNASHLPVKAAGISDPGVDSSLPSTAASSSASLGTLALSCNSISKKARSKRRVSLHNDVTVVPIPMRSEYPNLVREQIWSSATELYQNAARNTLEFAAEGFQWRNAADDEQMVHMPSGERIHPIHYMNITKSGRKAMNCRQQVHQEEINMTPLFMDAEPLPS